MLAIIKRPQALSDLAEIWNYIADNSEAQADSFVATIDTKFQTLAKQPGIGRLRDELAAGLRSLPVGRYVIFYLSLADGVEIIRVLHGSRDIVTIFHDDD